MRTALSDIRRPKEEIGSACINPSSGLTRASPNDTGTVGLVNTTGEEGVQVEVNDGQVPGLLMFSVVRKRGICWQSILPSSKSTVLGNVCGSLEVGW